MEMRRLCLQSLANFSANNRRNKELLFRLNIVAALRHLLFDAEAALDETSAMASPRYIELLEDIQASVERDFRRRDSCLRLQEAAMTAMRNLLASHAFERDVQLEVFAANGAEFFLRKLCAMRPVRLII